MHKEYIATPTQSGNDAPIASVKKNTLGGEVIWERLESGVFRGVLEEAFPEADTTFNTPGFSLSRFDDASVTLGMYCLGRSNDNAVLLLQNIAVIDGVSLPTCVLGDGIAQPVLIRIDVYDTLAPIAPLTSNDPDDIMVSVNALIEHANRSWQGE